MREKDIRMFITSRIPWIRSKLEKFETLEKEPARDFVDGEEHYYEGRPYQLRIEDGGRKSGVELEGRFLTLFLKPGADRMKRRKVLNLWYRERLKEKVPVIISRYEEMMNVRVREFGIKQMKTRWGTCNTTASRIWINLELAKRSPECLEYLVVHEMCHLLERRHDKRFYSFMTEYLPAWKEYKHELNRFPLGNTDHYA